MTLASGLTILVRPLSVSDVMTLIAWCKVRYVRSVTEFSQFLDYDEQAQERKRAVSESEERFSLDHFENCDEYLATLEGRVFQSFLYARNSFDGTLEEWRSVYAPNDQELSENERFLHDIFSILFVPVSGEERSKEPERDLKRAIKMLTDLGMGLEEVNSLTVAQINFLLKENESKVERRVVEDPSEISKMMREQQAQHEKIMAGLKGKK